MNKGCAKEITNLLADYKAPDPTVVVDAATPSPERGKHDIISVRHTEHA